MLFVSYVYFIFSSGYTLKKNLSTIVTLQRFPWIFHHRVMIGWSVETDKNKNEDKKNGKLYAKVSQNSQITLFYHS